MTGRCTGACGWEPGCFGCQTATAREELQFLALLLIPCAGMALIVGIVLGFDNAVRVVLLLSVLGWGVYVMALAAADHHHRGMARVAADRRTAQ